MEGSSIFKIGLMGLGRAAGGIQLMWEAVLESIVN